MAFFKVTRAKPKEEKNTYEEELNREKAQDNQEEANFWKEGSEDY